MRIHLNQRGITNLKAGLTVGEVGEINYPDGAEFRGWLDGQIARGAVSLVTTAAVAADLAAAEKTQHPDGAPAPKPPQPAASVYADSALGPTAGSTPEVSGPGAVDVDVSLPRGEPEQVYADGAEGLTSGSTSGEPLPVADEAKDLADANVTQHPEQVGALRGKPGKRR